MLDHIQGHLLVSEQFTQFATNLINVRLCVFGLIVSVPRNDQLFMQIFHLFLILRHQLGDQIRVHLYQSVLGLIVCERLDINHNCSLIFEKYVCQVQFHCFVVLVVIILCHLRRLALHLRCIVGSVAFSAVEVGWASIRKQLPFTNIIIILHSFFASQVILVKHDFDNLSFALIGVLIGELRPIILLLLLTLQLLQVEPRILDR